MEPSKKTSNDYCNEGYALSSRGKYEEALKAFDKALRLNPRLVKAHTNRAYVFFQLERYQDALNDCNEALRLNPQDEYAHTNRTAALVHLGRDQEALKACDEVLRLNPQLAEAHNNKGFAFHHLGRKDLALTAYAEALRLNPRLVIAHVNRADVLNELGRYEDALKACNEAISLDSHHAQAYCNKGIALQRLGRYPQALDAFTEAIYINPKLEEAIAHRSEVQPIVVEEIFTALKTLEETMRQKRERKSAEQPVAVQQADDHHPTLALQPGNDSRTISGEGRKDNIPMTSDNSLPPLPPPQPDDLNNQRRLEVSSVQSQTVHKKQRPNDRDHKETANQQAISSQSTPPKGFTLLGLDIETDEQVLVTNASRRQATYIIGSTGTGKTGLIENMLLQNIRQNEGICLLDPHGDLTRNIIARMPENRLKDIIYLNIKNEDTPFGLNLFTCKNPKSLVEMQYAVDQVMHIFEKIFEVSRTTPRMAQYLRNCAYTIIANPGYTMAEIPMLLTDKKFRQKLVANVTDPQVLVFWKNYEEMRDPDKRAEATSTLNKLDEFLQPLTRNIVGQARSTIDFYEAMQQQKIILMTLDVRMDNVTSLIGSTIVALLLNAAYQRANIEQEKRKHFSVSADEFQRFATEDFAILLTEARKFAIATTIAHQSREQLTIQNRATSLQAANLIVFRVSGPDAKELASNFDSTPLPFQVKKSISQNPIDYLINQTHPNVQVRELTQSFLLPIVNKIKLSRETRSENSEKIKLEFRTAYPQYTWYSYRLVCNIQDIDTGMFEVRRLLVAVMEQQTRIGSPEFVELTQKLLYSLRAVIGWADIELDRSKKFIPDQKTKQALNEFIVHLVADLSDKKAMWGDATQAARDWFLLTYSENDKNYMSWNGEITTFKSWVEGAVEAIILFVSQIYQLCDLLAQEPIEVAYGPQDGAHMTYADMMNLVANKLANLQQFTACIKVGTDKGRVEHTIRTLTPERGIGRKELEQRIATITANNLEHGYLRHRKEVENEIMLRQELRPLTDEGDYTPRREY